ncbi:MAG: transposase [Prevotellaceae bacterium]|jgi:hypothetical protein|nr:transposase [Prevotellaceae bacterium]
MTKSRGIRCPQCQNFNVQKRGRRNNKIRPYRNDCQKSFTRSRKAVSSGNRLAWYQRRVEYGHTIAYVAKRSGYGQRTLKRYFYERLSRYPTWHIQPLEKVSLPVDGTYFANKVCLVLYRDNDAKATRFYRLTDGEWFDELAEGLNNLISLGIRIESVTCDGLSGIIKAVRTCAPGAIVQRRTVHVRGECLSRLTRNPRRDAGREPRQIVCRLSSIANHEQWGYRVASPIRWEERRRAYLNRKSYVDDSHKYRFTHRLVRKAFVHIKRAPPNLFRYLDNADIPKSTNALESFFGHLKTNLRQHRGLSKEHFKYYVRGYLCSKNNRDKYKNRTD